MTNKKNHYIIELRSKNDKITERTGKMEKRYKSVDLSRFFDVTIATIGNWIKDGKLEAYQTVGGHYRFKGEDVLKFARKNGMMVPEELKMVSASPKAKYKVLVVDDEPDIVKALRSILEELSDGMEERFGLETAKNGMAAGIKLVEFMPDLVILDGRMPGIHGAELCKEIKSHERFNHVKVLGYTAFEEEGKKLEKAGADKILLKSSGRGDMDVLRRAVCKLLGIDLMKVNVAAK